MAKTPKYAGVTQNEDGSWSYRLKVKLPDGKLFDTRIRKDPNGNPFLRARDAYEAKKAHAERLKNPPTEEPKEQKSPVLREIYENYLLTEGRKRLLPPSASRRVCGETMWSQFLVIVKSTP